MNNKSEKTIALFEMLGGIVGCIIVLYASFKFIVNPIVNPNLVFMPTNIYNICFMVIGLAMFLFSFFAGLLLWKRHKLGYSMTVITQCLQIPMITSSNLSYLFFLGLYVAFIMGPGPFLEDQLNFNFIFNVGSGFDVNFNQPHSLVLGLNLLPILFLRILYKNRKKQKREEAC